MTQSERSVRRQAIVKPSGGIKPKLSLGISLPVVSAGMLRLVFPFKRSWPAILVMGAMTAVMCFPLISTFDMFDFGGDMDLFQLVINIFVGAWTLGWAVGVSILLLIFLGLLLGREVVTVRPGVIRIRLEIPPVGIGAEFEADRMRNLRTASPDEKRGVAWRGPHLAFDWGGKTVRFGSHIDDDRGRAIMGGIETALGARVQRGERAEQDLDVNFLSARRESPPPPEPQGAETGGAIHGPAGIDYGSPSTLALILANLVPLAGVVFLDWQLGDVMVLYWAESAVVGLFNVLKMAVIDRAGALLAGPFFLGHFTAFMAIHFLFVYVLFVRGIEAEGAGIPLSEVGAMFLELWPALLALFVSHGYSFFANFIGRREFEGRTLRDQMGEPYGRVIVMHVTLIFGGFIVMALKTALPVLVLLIGLKIAADAKAHVKQHGLRTA